VTGRGVGARLCGGGRYSGSYCRVCGGGGGREGEEESDRECETRGGGQKGEEVAEEAGAGARSRGQDAMKGRWEKGGGSPVSSEGLQPTLKTGRQVRNSTPPGSLRFLRFSASSFSTPTLDPPSPSPWSPGPCVLPCLTASEEWESPAALRPPSFAAVPGRNCGGLTLWSPESQQALR